MNPRELRFKEWSDGVAELAVDALIDAELVDKDKFREACSIVGEEIFVRLILGDLPDAKTPLKGTTTSTRSPKRSPSIGSSDTIVPVLAQPERKIPNGTRAA